MLIEKKVVKIISSQNGNRYGIKGTSLFGPDYGTCTYSLFKNGSWTKEINTAGKNDEDLATIVANGGFDIHPDVRKKHHDKWIETQFKLHSK